MPADCKDISRRLIKAIDYAIEEAGKREARADEPAIAAEGGVESLWEANVSSLDAGRSRPNKPSPIVESNGDWDVPFDLSTMATPSVWVLYAARGKSFLIVSWGVMMNCQMLLDKW